MNYVTFVQVGAGGSWAKDETPMATAKKCAQIIKEDWGSMFAVAGKECSFPIWKLPEGETDWNLDHQGLMVDGEWLDPVEHIELVIPS